MKRAMWLIVITAVFLFTAGATAVFLFTAGDTLAQQGIQDSQQARQYIGRQVTNTQGEQLGTVDQVIVDSQTGNLQYMILSLADGQGSMAVAVENINQQGQQLVADFDASQFQQLAGGQDLSQIQGKQVMGQDGSQIGTVSNVVVGEGGDNFVIVTGPDNTKYPIPLNAVQQGPQQQLQARISQQNLAQAPSYQQGFPDLANQNWQNEIRGYYEQQQQQQAGQRQAQRDIIPEQVQPPEAAGTDVLVSQPAPEIRVTQRQPEIQVTQPPPRVIIRQRQPEIQVQVRQPEPEVQVIQPEPEVAVQMPKPEVQVQTPEPRVAIEQPEPQVKVRQPEPEVAVQQQDRPQVIVQRQGEPQVEMREPEEQVQVDVEVIDTGEWIGNAIYTDQGDQLGTVNDVIGTDGANYILMTSAENNRIYPVPMQQVETRDGRLVARFDQQQLQNAPSYTEEEINQMNQQQLNQEVRAYYGKGQGQQQQQQGQ